MKNVGYKLLMLIPIFLSCIISYKLGFDVQEYSIIIYLILAALSIMAWYAILVTIPLVEE